MNKDIWQENAEKYEQALKEIDDLTYSLLEEEDVSLPKWLRATKYRQIKKLCENCLD